MILSIESSCDDSCIALLDIKTQRVLLEKKFSQVDLHAKYGGVVPEIAARSHAIQLQIISQDLIKEANISMGDLMYIAVTTHPGLIGGLLVGTMFARGLAQALKIPCFEINHLEGHIMSVFIENEIKFPFLSLLVSGGHCQLLIANEFGKYEKLGETLDDSAGEAFDKIAKMLGLGYPGGPIIEKMARDGDENKFKFKIPMINSKDINFSFSGLKTAVSREINSAKNSGHFNDQYIKDMSASAQKIITLALLNKLELGCKIYKEKYAENAKYVTICGGVAANEYIKNSIKELLKQYSLEFLAPSIKYATDNASMIGMVGLWKVD